jgi:hypothetical protein
MAYDRVKIFEQAKEVIVKHKLFFVDDIVAFLPCSNSTFYDFFPANSEQLDELKELLNQNRTTLKVSMRSKWYTSNAPALQMALMKLISTDEELKKLSMTYTESNVKAKLDTSRYTDEELEEKLKEYDK